MRTHHPLPPDNSVLILNIVVLSTNFAVLPHIKKISFANDIHQVSIHKSQKIKNTKISILLLTNRKSSFPQ